MSSSSILLDMGVDPDESQEDRKYCPECGALWDKHRWEEYSPNGAWGYCPPVALLKQALEFCGDLTIGDELSHVGRMIKLALGELERVAEK